MFLLKHLHFFNFQNGLFHKCIYLHFLFYYITAQFCSPFKFFLPIDLKISLLIHLFFQIVKTIYRLICL